LTILPPVTTLAVGLPAQRAIAQRFRAMCIGTFRTSRDVRLESVMCCRADIGQSNTAACSRGALSGGLVVPSNFAGALSRVRRADA
jgi:hypothetical protein